MGGEFNVLIDIYGTIKINECLFHFLLQKGRKEENKEGYKYRKGKRRRGGAATPSSASRTTSELLMFSCRLYGLTWAMFPHLNTRTTSFFLCLSIVCSPCKLYEHERLDLHACLG